MVDDLGYIRPARSDDGAELTRIVRESAAYDGEYRRMVEGIMISPEQIARDLVYVYEIRGAVAGFYSLVQKGGQAELDFLFVQNHMAGQGIGRLLFLHMLTQAGQRGYREVVIVSHPPSEAFYARMGAVRVAILPPSGRATWPRPRMVVRTQYIQGEAERLEQ